MEKTKVLCLVLAIVLASAGTAGIVMGFGGETNAPITPDNAVNTVLDKPEEGTPVDRSAIENLYIAQGELQRKGGFVGTTRGSTTSAGIKQEVINNRVVVNGNVFKEMITVGIVKNAYQLFMFDGNYLYRKVDSIKSATNIKWANTASKYAEEDFLEKFGHRSDSLTGYILNDETIVSGELEKEENGLYQYRYILDINTAPARMLREMKTNSNMSGYSTYVKAEIIVVMDSDWQVKTVTTDCKYKVPMFGGVDCVEDITETFSDLTSQDLPEKDFFEKFFDADVQKPVEKDPDALSILMDMFEPYIGNGNSLNASIVATDNGQNVLNGLVSAKIDIENLENIEVSAKIGEDLFVEYQRGNVFVTYRDFKASTTVDGIMSVVNAFMPQSETDVTSDEENTEDDILSKFTYSIENGVCTVSLPLELGEEKLELNIYANVVEDGYQFTNANVTFGSLKIDVELANGFEAPEHSGEYPEILGLLDIVQNGVIYGNVNAFGFDVDVMFDMAKKALLVNNDDLSVIYRNGTVYAEFGAIKAKLNVSDIDRIMTLLRLAGIIDGDSSFELPQISVEQALEMLGNVNVSQTDNGVKFELSLDGMSAAVYLVSAESGWNLDKITATFGENVVTVSAAKPTATEIPEVDDSQYANVMDLLNTFVNPIVSLMSASSYGAEFNFDIASDGKIYNVAGSFAYDVNKNIKVNAIVSNDSATLVKANVTVADKVVYLDVNGLKTAFEIGDNTADIDLPQIVGGIKGINGDIDGIIESVYGIIDIATNLDVSDIDFANLIKDFDFADGKLALTVNADIFGLGDVGIKLSVNAFNGLVVELSGLCVSSFNLDLEATVSANVGKVKVPDASEYVLNLKGNVEGVEFAVSADLINMDIFASVNVYNPKVLARYVDGKVYISVGEIAVVGTVSELGALIEYVTSSLGIETPSFDISGLTNIELSVETVLKALVVDIDGESLHLGLSIKDFAEVSVDFDNAAEFAGITANVMGYAAEIKASDEQAEKLDTNKVYVPVESLARQIVEIYNNYKNVASTGISAKVNAAIEINGQPYTFNATVNYNNGLHLNIVIADGVNALLSADMYLVNNTLYLDVNGIRFATELPESSVGNVANTDISAVIGLLGKAKGYNEVLDSLIETAEALPEKLQGINYLDLLNSLTYENGKLSVAVNGELLGLSNFEAAVIGTKELTATVNGIAIGKVVIASLQIETSPACEEITAPASEYVTELEVEVMDYKVTAKLDLLNKTVAAKTTLLGHELGIYYVDNVVYVSYGEVKAKLNVTDINRVISAISSFIEGGIPSVEMPELDAKQIFNSLNKVTDGNGYALNVTVFGAAVTLNFDENANLVNANVIFNDVEFNAVRISGATYPSFNLNADYVDLADLAEQAASVYDSYKSVASDGISLHINSGIAVNGNAYTLIADVKYNNGLYINASIADTSNVLARVNIYIVNNTLYAEVNGIRFATELPELSIGGNANIDVATAIGMLSKVKGYNEILDSVIAVIEQLPAKIQEINYLDLLASLAYKDGELSVGINGELVGLSAFEATVSGTKGLNASISNLTIGNVTILSLVVDAAPVCEEITAPASEYVTELEVEVMGYKVTAKLDSLNKTVAAKTTLLGHELGIYYTDNVVYVSYGEVKAKLNVADIDKLLDVISAFIDGGIPSVEMTKFDVKQILNSLTKTADSDGYSLSVAIAGVSVTLNFDSDAKLAEADISVKDTAINASLISGASYPAFDINDNYVDLVSIAETFVDEIRNVMNAQGYDITLNGNFAFGNSVYDVAANVTFNGGLYVNANVSYKTANIANVELWLVDNVLYVSMGELKLAVAMPQSTLAVNEGIGQIDLTVYKGYNPYIDGILDVVQGIIDKFAANGVDYIALIDGLTFENGELTLAVNGEQVGLPQFSVKLAANSGLTANLTDLIVDKLTANFTANVKASAVAVNAPVGDFTTNLSVKIDDKNTLYANLDLINGVYNFRLDDLYLTYADNVVKVNKGDIYVSGNINQILDFVKKIDDLVNEFSGATSSTLKGINLDAFKNIDIKAIVQSLTLVTDGNKATIGANLFGFDIQATFAYGKLHTVTMPVSAIDKTLEIEPCKAQTFDRFNGEHEYIQIEQVFNDYFPVIEKLVHTNSWKFNFDGDTLLTINQNVYKVASGSYFEFYYKNTEGFDTFKLRVKLDVQKQKADGIWQPYMRLDIVYKDGNIYITDTGRLIDGKKESERSTIRLTVSIDALVRSYGLYDQIVAVVPQIGELVDSMMAAMKEAESNAENISYSTIINDVSYTDGLFGIDLNGASLLSKLGAVVLSAQTYGDGLSLNSFELAYDGITLQVNNLRVYASETAEVDGKTEYAVVNDINAYDFAAYHMDFNSLYELLSSFVITAMPTEGSDGSRSFYITGTAIVKLTLGFDLADIKMGLSLKVDIDKYNNVYITAKITRTNDKVIGIMSAYDDKGGDSYLYFDGVNGTFTVIRNSNIKKTVYWDEEETYYYCTKHNIETWSSSYCQRCVTTSKHIEARTRIVQKSNTVDSYYNERDYVAENISSADFTAGILDYIFEMINLNSSKNILLGNNSLESLVKDNIANSNNNNDFGIEDVFTNYSYTESSRDYKVELNLKPIDSNLTSATLDIYHDERYMLNKLTGDLSSLNGLCTVKLDMGLQQSVCGEAKDIVRQVIFW